MAKAKKQNPAYLTQEGLGLILKEFFPDLVFVFDKGVPSSKNKRYRPDYRCESEKLILEFDGDSLL